MARREIPADPHHLYQLSVQNPEFEIELLDRLFLRRHGRKPLTLREDFCGTALLCADWVRSAQERSATGVDLDTATLRWGREHNVEPLKDAASRVTLLCQDVRAPGEGRFDAVVALNYSYSVFKRRSELKDYFENARRSLVPDGAFVLDCFGGWEAETILKERRRIKGFVYEWEQSFFNPVDNDFRAHIHFKLPDGRRLDRAFSYDWRHWTLAELRELLFEVGFGDVVVLWEGADEKGGGNGIFRPRKVVANEPRFTAYLVAWLGSPRASRGD